MCGRIILAFALATVTATVAAAQSPQTVRVRGTIVAVDGPMLTVRSREGETLAIRLAGDLRVSSLRKLSLSDIAKDSFVGVGGMPQPDGTIRALQVVVFPEAMRGTGEGHRAWELPESTMTNATVADSVEQVSGRTLVLTYKTGQQTILVPPEVPIVTPEPAGRSDLVAGAAISLSVTQQPDGTLQSGRITVGKPGAAPPL
jgi:hypothetical protein